MAFKLKSLYGILGEVVENVGGIMGAALVEESDKEYKLVADTCFYYIESLNINIHKADLFIYDTDTEEYEITDIVYLFFDTNKNKLVYSEQGSNLCVSLYNYCRLVLKKDNITIKEVEEIECVYQLDEGEVLNKYSSYSIT